MSHQVRLTSLSRPALQVCRRSLWTPSALLKRKLAPPSSGRGDSDGTGKDTHMYPSSSAFWSGLPPNISSTTSSSSTRERIPKPAHAPATSAQSHTSPNPPTPSHFDTYEEYLEHYTEELASYKNSAFTARDKAKRTLEVIKKQDGETPRRVQREYLWTFVPMIIMMCVYFNDVSNQTCAQMVQRRTEEHARLHCSVKWEKL